MFWSQLQSYTAGNGGQTRCPFRHCRNVCEYYIHTYVQISGSHVARIRRLVLFSLNKSGEHESRKETKEKRYSASQHCPFAVRPTS